MKTRKSTKIKYLITVVIIIAIIVVGGYFKMNSASYRRWQKDIFSDYNNGLQREIIVYGVTDEVLYTYTGKFDILNKDSSGNVLIFEDENGKRHNIYLTTGNVIVNELE